MCFVALSVDMNRWQWMKWKDVSIRWSLIREPKEKHSDEGNSLIFERFWPL